MLRSNGNGSCPSDPTAPCSRCERFTDTEWNELDAEDLCLLSRAKVRRRYASGQSLFCQGDANSGLYCLSAGTVALRQLDEAGNSVLLGLAYPGDVLGYRSLVSGVEHKTSAEALGPCRACKIGRKTALDLIQRRPQLGMAFLRRSSREIERMHKSILRSAALSNRGRLLQIMVSMMEHHGRPTGDGTYAIDLPVSRRDLASMIGARHETLSRVMSRLEEEQLAEFSGRRVVIPNLDAFVGAANGG
ncbi:MAG: Crp/Fnr family transcriptional regulator [Kiloniellales bacterium]|nr:Crp/Fnr family transcriptional regulator [Kiloniellales bacterium]